MQMIHAQDEEIAYWEYPEKPHRCNHEGCNGVITITITYPYCAGTIAIAQGYCEECGQHYRMAQGQEWYLENDRIHEEIKRAKEEKLRNIIREIVREEITRYFAEHKPVMQEQHTDQREERRNDTTAEINRLIKGILTV